MLLQDASGKTVDLSTYKGKVVLIVNVASQCGFTPQYKELAALYDKYSSQGFVILGFPCNQVGTAPRLYLFPLLFSGMICASNPFRAVIAIRAVYAIDVKAREVHTILQLQPKPACWFVVMMTNPCMSVGQFGGQEPGSDAQVKKFAQDRGAKFPIMSKVDVNGSGGGPSLHIAPQHLQILTAKLL